MINRYLLTCLIFTVLFVTLLDNKISIAEAPKFKLQAVTIKYNDNNSIIIAEQDAYAIDQSGKEIFSDKIVYDKKKLTIQTYKNSIFKDAKGNEIFAENFSYDLNQKKIEAKNNVNFKDKLGNNFFF